MPTVTDFFAGLSEAQWSNMHFIIRRMRLKGITNEYAIAAILCIVSKESVFIPRVENDYSETGVPRIREVFRTKTAGLTDAEINILKMDPVKWFNFLYGGRNGNRKGTNDGYMYRGRFLNQITFRNLYEKLSVQLQLPELLTNPDKYINDITVATDILIQYYKNSFQTATKTNLYIEDKKPGQKVRLTRPFSKEYGTIDINGFTDLQLAVRAMYHCNAGLGRSIEYIIGDHIKGLKKSYGRSNRFLQIVQQTK